MSRPLSLCVLTDGKPGHQNQSLGLAEAIARRLPAEISQLPVPTGKLGSWRLLPTPQPPPDLFIGAGHRTHAPLLQLSRRTGAPCVVLMKPSLPLGFFDLCLVPEHDLQRRIAANVLPTKGALNRVPPTDPARPRHGGLLLIGGPSGSHSWDGPATLRRIRHLVAHSPHLPWMATDSRRTPASFLDELAAAVPELSIHPHTQTGPDWLPQHLASAQEVWVTEDSVSMIYEALSSGASVGLLPVPRWKKSPSRVARGIDQLVATGWLTRYDDASPTNTITPPPETLREADRIADLVIQRLLTTHS
ncbi:hypothetical protein HNR46_000864 [Haloferula luteola]|uniref:Nucleoside-diphosphate sugar epimerase n=1 Tax=Haloferula luteola TaxID=595692 RepID=A0A840V0P2_9BACT|nr:mitochondrial fission ELM1 family protein [Haloferula luteola]MBB5350636.1 hypothetical protein [Haloferula luteola]